MTKEKRLTSEPKEFKNKFRVLRLSDYFSSVRDPKNVNQNLVQDSISYIVNHFKIVSVIEVKGETYFVVEI